MKILLMNPPKFKTIDVIQQVSTCPRIGLASIAACLEEAGNKVYVIDPLIDRYKIDELYNKIRKLAPDILGISAYTEEIIDAGRFSEKIKEILPESLVVVGGPHASAIPERTLEEFGCFDIAVVGEGEQTMLELSEAVEGGKSINGVRGLVFRDNGKLKSTSPRDLISDINSLPFPAWHLFPIEKYRGYSPAGFKMKSHELELPVEGVRGCPYSCIFCYRVCGRKVRFRSPKRIADEIDRDVEEFKATHIHFAEGTFGIGKSHAIEICNELIRRGLNKRVKWEVGCRVNTVDSELLKKMKQAGCFLIGYGIESGDQRILNIIGKQTTLKQAESVIRKTKKVGIEVATFFILGLPYETEATINKTINLAVKLDARPVFAILVPFPGTVVKEMARKGEGGLKLLSENWSDYGKQLGRTLELQHINHRKLKELQRKAYFRCYARPTRVLRFFSLIRLVGMKNSLKKIIAITRARK